MYGISGVDDVRAVHKLLVISRKVARNFSKGCSKVAQKVKKMLSWNKATMVFIFCKVGFYSFFCSFIVVISLQDLIKTST